MKLVDEEVGDAIAQRLRRRLVSGDCLDGPGDEIAVVERVRVAQELAVILVEIGRAHV